MDEDIIKIAQGIMRAYPSMSPEQALQEASKMSQGAMSEGFTGGQARQAGMLGNKAQQQFNARQGPALGSVAGDVPQVSTGLLGPQGMQPRQQQQICPTCQGTGKVSFKF